MTNSTIWKSFNLSPSNTDLVKLAWTDLRKSLKANSQPNKLSVRLIDEFISSLDSTAKASEIRKILS